MVCPSLRPRVRVNLKDMRREELSRRDLMKVDDMSRQLTALAAKLSAL